METRTFRHCFGIGVTCGLRSMSGPAVTRWRANDPLRLVFAGFALGELVADKLPATPARTIPPALLFRALAGGFCGRSIASRAHADRTVGAIAGALGAVAGSYGGLALRGWIGKRTGIPDPVIALLEDAIALTGASTATRP